MSVGEWLNEVIKQDDEEFDDEPALFTDFYDEPEEEDAPPRVRRRDNDRERRDDRPDSRRELREERKRGFDHESAHTRGALNEVHSRLDKLSHQLERMSHAEAAARAEAVKRAEAAERAERAARAEAAARAKQAERAERAARAEQAARAEETALAEEAAARAKRAERAEKAARAEEAARRSQQEQQQQQQRPRRRPLQNGNGHSPQLTGAPARHRPPAGTATSIDDAIAEITARQHALDSNSASFEPAIAPPRMQTQPAPQAQPELQTQPAPPVQPTPPPPPAQQVRAAPQPQPALPVFTPPPPEPVLDLSHLDLQLRNITARIEALRPSSDLEASIKGIRADLSEIANLITSALPQRAVDSLEIEVKALADRIEHSRQCGVDTGALAGLERGLNEIHDALRVLTPAEGLVGFEDAVKGLSQKLDMIAGKDDPAALQQLETAIGALRGIVSHVASNETLTKVAEDVRALSAKVDALASTAVSTESLAAIEHRIDSLTNALAASADAGQAVPRELEKLLSGLIEKLEWVQLTHTDHAALAHLEDRIATLVQRFDTSDARFVHLEAVERGIADLLVHIEDIRGLASRGAINPMPAAQGTIERDVARTQDSLEAVQGTVEQVVDRLAMIESGIRQTATPAAPAPQPVPVAPPRSPAEPAPFSSASNPSSLPSSLPSSFSAAAMRSTAPMPEPTPADMPAVSATEITPPRAAASRNPIDPNLPPDHPLEPGSASGRPRSASAADRIAASEAAAGSVKPPVIADPGEKPNFIAAARRAAQAAAAAPATKAEAKAAKAEAKAAAKAKITFDLKQSTPRTRKLIVAGAAALILLGGIQIASKFFDSGAPTAPPSPPADTQQEKTSPPAAALPQVEQAAPPAATSAPAPTPAPAPAAPPDAAPSPLPNPKSSETVPSKPAPQAEAQPSAPMTLTPNVDITGSLPHAAAAPTGDKLPATIGGPTLRAAALSGDGAASYEVGMRFAEGHGVPANNAEAALWFERAAKQGLVPAQFRLGGLYEKGLGVKKNLVIARDLYLAAANKGNGKSMHNLAVLYAEGIDGSPDYTNAAHWFREAADRGITDSQYNLGILYARGIGAAQNFAESYKWFALAANQGDEDAGKKRDEVAAKLDPQSLTAARLAVQTWKAVPQPDEATNVKTPPGGWDVTQTNAVRPKPRPVTAAKAN